MKDTKIHVENVCKTFQKGIAKQKTALQVFLSLFSQKTQTKKFFALKNISFIVKKGEKIALFGKNGSGKSTLLKTIAGIYTQDAGNIQVHDSFVYLSGYAQNIEKKLTGKENILLLLTLEGFSKDKIQKLYKNIKEFSELGSFLHTPVFQYSSGMKSRLSFSIGITLLKEQNPSILLLDEVLAGGGDRGFQEKAQREINALLRSKEKTILFATHNSKIAQQFCSKAIVLEKGNLEFTGDIKEAFKQKK